MITAKAPRVAYFPDSFHEVNGVAHTSRHFEAFARRRNLPFLCVCAGNRTPHLVQQGNVWTLELPRGALSFALEKDLRFDPAFARHMPIMDEVLERFRPDLIHITGPSEMGLLGAGLANVMGLPLAAGWHTNVHEYAARRLEWFLRLLQPHGSAAAGQTIEDLTLSAAAGFYSAAQMLFAPNPELCQLLERVTDRPCSLMRRGVDATLFHPDSSHRPTGHRPGILGFVGRLSVEKNVAGLVSVQEELERMGCADFRFLIVGHGAEERWLRERLPRAEFAGVLHGEALAAAYARMDLFVFPSRTDTFGNVVLEALACGVPAIVTPDGGPKTIVRDGHTGRILPVQDFGPAIAAILRNPAQLNSMRRQARAYALTMSWDTVFERVYEAYQAILPDREHASVRLATPQEPAAVCRQPAGFQS